MVNKTTPEKQCIHFKLLICISVNYENKAHLLAFKRLLKLNEFRVYMSICRYIHPVAILKPFEIITI